MKGDGPRTSGGGRERLEDLERENAELRRANASLLTILAHWMMTAPSAPQGCGRGSAADLRAPSSGTPTLTNECARWRALVEDEAPWETVLVPRGTMR